MADKFLNTGGSGQANISNGTANIYAAKLAAANLDPSRPIKTNAVRELVSQNLDIADVNNLQATLDNVLTNPFVGTLQVSDLETDDTFSLNDELQKISNIASATQTPDVTVFNGEVDLQKVKSLTGNAEIELDDTDIDLITAAGDVNINANSISLQGPSLTFNGYDVLDTQGNKNLDATLTTTQTVFTQDQELITKKYVDDASGGGDADIKTQNISLGLTDNTKTTFDKGNVIFGINPMEVLDDFSIKQELNFNNITAPETGGFQFTIRNPILIKYVCFKVSHWGSADTTKVWNLYDAGSEQLITTLTLNKLKEYKGYYYTPFTSPVLIPAGSYKCALILNNGDKKHNFSSASAFFNDNLVGAGGVFSSPDPAPTLAFPNGGSNTPASAIVFDLLEKVVNNGTTELQQETKINSAKIGYEFDNYYLDGLGDGAGNLYGNPALTANAVYTNVLALGGIGASAGKATYEILDVIKVGTITNIFKKFRFAPWNTDGGFIIADFGVWRVEYQNLPVAGTTKWNIYANGAVIHTNTTNLIPYTSTFSEEEITISFDANNQGFTIKYYDTTLFTFVDTVPRTITQAQLNLYSVSGGALVGYTNTTTIYDQKVYNPASTTPIVNINKNLNNVEFSKGIEIEAETYDNQINFRDTTQTREQAAVGFIAGNGTNGLKWILGGAGDLNKVLFRTYASNDDIQFDTDDTNTMTLSSTGNLTLARGDLIATSGSIDTSQYKISGTTGEILKNANQNLIAGVNAGTFINNGNNNVLLGVEAGRDINEGVANVYIGFQAGNHIQGTVATPSSNNIAIGSFSQQGVSAVSNGSYNVSLGQASLYSITTGSNNTCYGANAGYSITTGENNTMVGHFAGDANNGDFNTCIGHNALAQGGTNRTAIGHISRCDADNQLCLGNGAVSQIINTGNGVCDLGSATHKFKDLHLSGGIIGMPYDVIFAATDEVNTITATGQKMSLRVPRSFQTSKIKVSVNSVGGAGFVVDIKQNGSLVQSIAQGSFLVSNTNNTTTYSEDNIITCEVSNIGAGTATGLKVYLIGKTI